MPWNGSGLYTRVHDWTTDAGNAIDIDASRMDAEDDSIAAALNNCRTKDGQNAATANLPMGGFKHTNAAIGSAATDYATLANIHANTGRYAVSGGAANAQTLAPSPAISAYAAGQEWTFKAGFTNTGAMTFAISGLATRSVKTIDGKDPAAGAVTVNRMYKMVDDGTNLILLGEATVLNVLPTAATPLYIDPLLRPILSLDTDTDHDINIAAGAVADSTGKYILNVPTEFTKQLDATWAAGDDAGGLNDTTFAALPIATDRTTIHVFLIGKIETDGSITVDAGFDTSITAANLLADTAVVAAGYTLYRRIGSLLLDASDNWYTFTQIGPNFYIAPHQFSTSVLTASFANYLTNCPTGMEGLDIIYGWGFSNATGSNVSASAAYGPSDLMTIQYGWMPATNGGNFAQMVWPVDSSGNIRLKHNVSGGSTKQHYLQGWIDRLDLA